MVKKLGEHLLTQQHWLRRFCLFARHFDPENLGLSRALVSRTSLFNFYISLSILKIWETVSWAKLFPKWNEYSTDLGFHTVIH